MYQIAYELTNRCDIACLTCLRDKEDARFDLDRDLVLRTLNEARDIGTRLVSFTGGEPTLHPDFIFLIDEAVKRGFHWITVTNGHNFELFRELFSCPKRKAALSLLAISLDGASEKVHDQNRGKGSFKKIMRTVTLLVAMGAKIRLQMTLTTQNMDEMEEFIMLGSTLGVKSVSFGYLQATQKNVAAGLMPSPEDFRRAQLRINKLHKMFSIEISENFGYYYPSPMFKCSVLNNNAMNIDYQGNMTFCCQLSNFGDSSYIGERQEIVADLNKVSLLEAYKVMLERIAEYNKTKAERSTRGEIKGLDLFPCFYCAKQFGKLDWLKNAGEKANGWQDADRELSEVLTEEKVEIRSLYPFF